MHRSIGFRVWLGCLVALGAGSDLALAQNQPCGNNETVVYGDTLYEIAQRCNATIEMILRLNPEITDPGNIAVGTTLAMPTAQGSPDREQPSRDSTPTPADWQVTVEPRSGPPGSQVTVQASGFPPGSRVLIGRGPYRSEYELQRHAEADPQGRVRVDGQVPPYADPGDRWVFVAKAPGSGEEAVSGTFRVTAAEQTPPRDDHRDRRRQPDTNREITVSGRLTRTGVECPVIRGRTGRLYSLAGANLENSRIGDRITATGTVAKVSDCQQGTTIQVSSLGGGADDGDRDDAEMRRISGVITGQGVECPALKAGDGTLYTLTGQNVEKLRPGQRVFVEGTEAEMSFCQQGTTLAVERMKLYGKQGD